MVKTKVDSELTCNDEQLPQDVVNVAKEESLARIDPFAGVPAARPSRTHLHLPDDLAFKVWRKLGQGLQNLHQSNRWWLGDWLNHGEDHYGEEHAQEVDDLRLSVEQLRKLSWIARNVPPFAREHSLSLRHHEAVAKLDPAEQKALLAEAAHKWTSDRLRAEVGRRFPTKKVRTVPKKAKTVSKKDPEPEPRPAPETRGDGACRYAIDLYFDRNPGAEFEADLRDLVGVYDGHLQEFRGEMGGITWDAASEPEPEAPTVEGAEAAKVGDESIDEGKTVDELVKEGAIKKGIGLAEQPKEESQPDPDESRDFKDAWTAVGIPPPSQALDQKQKPDEPRE